MKIKDGFVMRKVGGGYVAVPILERAKEFNGMLRLNETGAFLYSQLMSDKSAQELVSLLAAEYGIGADEAEAGVRAFLETMEENGLLEKT